VTMFRIFVLVFDFINLYYLVTGSCGFFLEPAMPELGMGKLGFAGKWFLVLSESDGTRMKVNKIIKPCSRLSTVRG